MGIALACSWRPRGEQTWLERLRPQLEEVYDDLIFAIPPDGDLESTAPVARWPSATVFASQQRFWGRYEALKATLETGASHAHYADLDMLVHWIDARPDEWRAAVDRIRATDCLITGRTPRAFQTRSRAIQDTERIINAVCSHLLGQPADFGLGSRGFSRRAVEAVIANSTPGGFGDAEWPILVRRSGYAVSYVAVDGVDWETPDHYRGVTADDDTRGQVTETYDDNPRNWAARVRTAQTIIDEAIAATSRPLR